MRPPCPESISLEVLVSFLLGRFCLVTDRNGNPESRFFVLARARILKRFIMKPSRGIVWMSSFVWSWHWCLMFALNQSSKYWWTGIPRDWRMSFASFTPLPWTLGEQWLTRMAVLWTDRVENYLHETIVDFWIVSVHESKHLSGLSKWAICLSWPNFWLSLLSPFWKLGLVCNCSGHWDLSQVAIFCWVLVQETICCKTFSCAILEWVNCTFFKHLRDAIFLIAMFFLSVATLNYGMHRHGRIWLECYSVTPSQDLQNPWMTIKTLPYLPKSRKWSPWWTVSM